MLTIDSLEQVLAEAGIAMSALVKVRATEFPSGSMVSLGNPDAPAPAPFVALN